MRGIHSLLYPQAYKPSDLDRIYYIDQRTDTSGVRALASMTRVQMSKGRDSMSFIRGEDRYADSGGPSDAL